LHFARLPERPRTIWPRANSVDGSTRRDAGLLRAGALLRFGRSAGLIGTIAVLDRLEPLYVSLYLLCGLAIFGLALANARSTTALRQLRWIVWGAAIGSGPFLLVYAVPFAFGATPSLAMQLTAVPLGLVPLAFASAIVRYRLMDVEVILKRLLVYTAAVSAIAAIYMVILGTTDLYFVSSEDDHRWVIAALATIVVLQLARPVKDAVQSRHRPRLLPRPLRLPPRARRLRPRTQFRPRPRSAGRAPAVARPGAYALVGTAVPDVGHRLRHLRVDPPRRLRRDAAHRARAARPWRPAQPGPRGALRRSDGGRAFPAEEVEHWRDAGVFYFVPCVSKRLVDWCWRSDAARTASR
jgi:hypothetical protein